MEARRLFCFLGVILALPITLSATPITITLTEPPDSAPFGVRIEVAYDPGSCGGCVQLQANDQRLPEGSRPDVTSEFARVIFTAPTDTFTPSFNGLQGKVLLIEAGSGASPKVSDTVTVSMALSPANFPDLWLFGVEFNSVIGTEVGPPTGFSAAGRIPEIAANVPITIVVTGNGTAQSPFAPRNLPSNLSIAVQSDVDPTAGPEPSTLLLLGTGLAGIVYGRSRRRTESRFLI